MKWENILKSDFSTLDNIGLKNLYFNLKDTAMTEEDNKFLFKILQEMIRRGMVYDTKKKNKKE